MIRVGSWARSGAFTGLVAAVDDYVTLFDPAARQSTRVPAAEVEPLPAGAVTVTLRVDLPLPHGLVEQNLRRWAASLTDDVLRERAAAALTEAGLDPGAALPPVTVELASSGPGALCLAGHRTPAEAPVACAECGREAVPPPARPDGDVLGLR